MKVFVGFGYNDRDKWISNIILPFIKELGCEISTGEEMQGESLSEGVKKRITESDACIGFLTRRGEADNNGKHKTHRWVIDELVFAHAKEKVIFEIREKDVDQQGGMLGDRQRFEFSDKTELMLEIAKFINKEKAKLTHKIFMLLPDDLTKEIRPHLNSRDTRCMYQFLDNGKFYNDETRIEKFQGGLGIIVRKIPRKEALLKITITGPQGINWSSDFISLASSPVKLEKSH